MDGCSTADFGEFGIAMQIHGLVDFITEIGYV